MYVHIGAGANWITSAMGILGGIGIALMGAVATHLITATNTELIIFVAMAALGSAGTGLAAKDYNTHSTAAQVQTSTSEVSRGEAPKS